MSKRLTIVLVGVVVVALVAVAVMVGTHWWRDSHRTRLEQASTYAPADAQRLSWTDWAAVRKRVGADLDAGSSTAQVQHFLDKGYDADLTSASALVDSANALQTYFGFSPATVSWELFSQAKKGAVVILKMPDGTDFGDLADHLDTDGYQRPQSDSGVWVAGQTLLPKIEHQVTPELQFVALDADDGLVLTSDGGGYLQQVLSGLGDQALPKPMQQVVTGSGDALSAAVYAGDYTCSSLAMSQADSSDQAEGAQLVKDAGKVSPISAFAMSVQPDRHVLAVLAFESDDQARANADSRAKLASGPAPGQGGSFSDRFSIASSSADGDLVTLDLVPHKDTYVFSDLSTGPLLFATC